MIKLILNSLIKVDFNYALYQPKGRKKYNTKFKNNIKYDYPSDEKLKLLSETNSLGQLVKLLNIPQKALWYHLNKRNISTFHTPKKEKIKKDRHAPRINQRKIKRPSKEELFQLIENKPFSQIGKMFNTTDNNIRKWAISYGLNPNRYPRGYWQKLGASTTKVKGNRTP